MNSNTKLNQDPDTRVSTAGVELPVGLSIAPGKSFLTARIEERMAQRKQVNAFSWCAIGQLQGSRRVC